MRAADGSCASCHFRVLGVSGYVCGYAGQRVRVDDPTSGACAAWRRYFDAYTYRENRHTIRAAS